MTHPSKISVITRQTLIPIGLLGIIASGIWVTAWSYFDISNRLHNVEVQISSNRWTYYEMSDAWEEVHTKNPGFIIPDYDKIHRKYHPGSP